MRFIEHARGLHSYVPWAHVLVLLTSLICADPAAGQLIWSSPPAPFKHPNSIGSLDCSPDGTQLVTVAHNRSPVYVWDAATGTEIRRLAGHDFRATSVAFSPGGTRVASGSFDKTVRL